MAVSTPNPEHLHGLVDMGSNGIRFSITDLSPPTTRILPTLYTSRAGISLYDAQYSTSGDRIAIPEKTIAKVIDKLTHFKRTCADFRVPESNITILATEATRTAVNSAEFRSAIKSATDWEVQLLAKEDEGRVGALGVATSLGEVKGLVMDLGGGSTQLTWLVSDSHTGEIKMPREGAVSMPFGAAALSRRLEEAEKQGKGAKKALAEEVKQRITEAFKSLDVPHELTEMAKKEGGYALYLSGGGFRGWGFVLMSQHKVNPYPIPVINGFRAARSDFLDTTAVQAAAMDVDSDEDSAIFRVSQRRANQVPAVAFLVTALSEALPHIKEVRFCQGGVREGYLTTTGILASAHGLSHSERCTLALLLCERWGGSKDLPPTDIAFFHSMQSLAGAEQAWWARYLGRVGALVGAVYPSGRGEKAMSLSSTFSVSKKGDRVLVLRTGDQEGKSLRGIVEEEVKKVEKAGKKKNWIGGKEGWGIKVEVQ
ncbi:Ppx-GppA-domain-containing protein [Aureobasidium pullulans]|nr:Ppx-GppA-domain-containing protein [Aureobasidium pullulans]TIA12369.1 Ppx-GppA-domain-containing protein [Aureobasidium pullulans]